NKSRKRIDKDFRLHSALLISPPAMICQVRHLRRDSIARWPSIYNAPVSRERYLGIVVPERKAKMPVQAIDGRCGKCGYRLAWVLVGEKRLLANPLSSV